MTRRVVRPLFPQAPTEYNATYMASVVQAFSVFLEQVQNPGDLRATTLTLTELKTNDQGLEVGGLFQVEGVVHIALESMPYLAGTSATGEVGSVTVTTT